MRMKVRMPKSAGCKSVKLESKYITVTASEYELMNFIGTCMYLKEKSKVRKYDIYRG